MLCRKFVPQESLLVIMKLLLELALLQQNLLHPSLSLLPLLLLVRLILRILVVPRLLSLCGREWLHLMSLQFPVRMQRRITVLMLIELWLCMHVGIIPDKGRGVCDHALGAADARLLAALRRRASELLRLVK